PYSALDVPTTPKPVLVSPQSPHCRNPGRIMVLGAPATPWTPKPLPVLVTLKAGVAEVVLPTKGSANGGGGAPGVLLQSRLAILALVMPPSAILAVVMALSGTVFAFRE